MDIDRVGAASGTVPVTAGEGEAPPTPAEIIARVVTVDLMFEELEEQEAE